MTATKVSLIALSLGLAGCAGDVYDSACTLIGCGAGLVVEVGGSLPADYSIELEPEADVSMGLRCTPEESCTTKHFVQDFTPETVTVTITGPEFVHVETFTPTYSLVRPNGADCPPECRQGTIRVVVP